MERLRNFWWYAFVFLLPWQTVWILREVFVGGEKWQYATAGLYASDVALLACATLLVVRAPREVWRAVSRDAIARVLFALCVWSLLSALWAMERDMALLSAWRIFLMALAYVCARYGEISLRKTLATFLVSMMFQAMLALSQWVGQYVFPSTFLGMAEHDPARWGTFVLKTESGRFLRAYGGFEHPNVLGGALAIATFFGVWLSATTRKLFLRAGFLGTTVVASFTLVFSFSRSAWIGFGAEISMIAFVAVWMGLFRVVRRSKKRVFLTHSSRVGAKSARNASRSDADGFRKILFFDLLEVSSFENNQLFYKKNSYRFLAALFLAMVSFFVGFFLVRDIASSRFSDETLAREGSLSDRAAYMQQALGMIREQPIFGVGSGNFTAFTQAYFPKEGRFVGDFQPVHMVPILVFAELGAVGFTLFALLFIVGFVRAWKGKNIFAGSILCALLFPLFLDHWLWSGHFGAIFLGFTLGVMELFSVSSRRE